LMYVTVDRNLSFQHWPTLRQPTPRVQIGR
jgi:hypothetical protein